MVLSTLADIIYKFYCLLHCIVTFICYIGYLLYYIIYNVIVTVQNVTVFAQIVYEDNRHLIQDTKAIIVGTSNFFITNFAKVCNAVSFAGTAFLHGTVALANLLKWIIWSAKQGTVLVGEAAWFLITAPYQLLVLFDGILSHLLQLLQRYMQNAYNKCIEGLVGAMHFMVQDVPVQSAFGLVLLLLIYQNPEPLKIMLDVVKEKVLTGGEFLANAFRSASLHLKIVLSNRARRMEIVPEGVSHRSTVGTCIICEENDRAVAFVPCGHLCVCKGCARSICYYNPKCPLCRSYIKERLEVYI
uniref:RING-type domain-containing protein n=1 Tax=Anopheles culicifacies TaxID=139723 RepID=A0A182MRZ6_9DIPT